MTTDVVRDTIEQCLRSHKMQHWVSIVDDYQMELVDALTPPGDVTVARGFEEIELLADAIAVALEDAGAIAKTKEI